MRATIEKVERSQGVARGSDGLRFRVGRSFMGRRYLVAANCEWMPSVDTPPGVLLAAWCEREGGFPRRPGEQ